MVLGPTHESRQPQPPHTRTRAHLVAQARGGRMWVWACRRCNMDQGLMSLSEWAARLGRENDPRFPRVVRLVSDLEAAGWEC